MPIFRWSRLKNHRFQIFTGVQVLKHTKVYIFNQVSILQNWYFLSKYHSKIGFFNTNIRVLVLCTILVKNFYEKTIGLAKKSHYITPIFSQPQHISFFINNRLCVGWNFYANPFVILLFYFTYLEFNFFSVTKTQNLYFFFLILFWLILMVDASNIFQAQ